MENGPVSASAPSREAYQELADAGTQILRLLPAPEIVAVEALHFRNSHPNSLKVFHGFLHRPRPRDIMLAIAKAAWHNVVSVLARGARRGPDTVQRDAPDKVDILFVSHSLNGNPDPGARDLYFGDLPEQLKVRGFKTATVLINHSGDRPDSPASEPGRMLLPQRIGRRGELAITGRLLRAFWALQRSAFGEGMQARLAKYASWNAFSPASRSALRIGDQIGDAVNALDPTAILVTFEGHSWERLAFRRAREAKPPIQCLAYAHAPLFPMHHALTVDLGHGYDPDILFVPGEAVLEILRSHQSMRGRDLRVLGSARASAPATPTGDARQPSLCLLLPEGLVSEVQALLELCVSVARGVPDIRFRVRMHPALTREMFLEKAPVFRDLPENVEWSRGTSLKEDLQAAQWAIYRGSSAIVAAPAEGARPLYYRLPDEQLSIDPLFSLGPYRQVVENGEDLIRFLSAPGSFAETDRVDAERFCASYYQPMNPDLLVEAVSGTSRR